MKRLAAAHKRFPGLTQGVCLLATALALGSWGYATHQAAQTQTQTLESQQRALQKALTDLEEARREQAELAESLAAWQKFVATPPDDQPAFQALIAQRAQDVGVLSATVQSLPATDTAADTHFSHHRFEITLSLPHEAPLFAVLDALADTPNLLLSVEQCDIQRAGPTPPLPRRQLEARCQGIRYQPRPATS